MECVLIGSRKSFESLNLSNIEDDLNELESLAYTLSFSVLDKNILNLKKLTHQHFMAKVRLK